MNKTLTLCLLATVLSGCGDSEKSLAERAGSAVGAGMTGFLSGAASGIDNTMVIEAELGSQASEKGLSMTTSKSNGLSSEKSFSAYVVASQPFKGTLLAKAFDKDGQEVGRAKTEIDFKKEDADYVVFTFSEHMDSALVSKYLIDVSL